MQMLQKMQNGSDRWHKVGKVGIGSFCERKPKYWWWAHLLMSQILIFPFPRSLWTINHNLTVLYQKRILSLGTLEKPCGRGKWQLPFAVCQGQDRAVLPPGYPPSLRERCSGPASPLLPVSSQGHQQGSWWCWGSALLCGPAWHNRGFVGLFVCFSWVTCAGLMDMARPTENNIARTSLDGYGVYLVKILTCNYSRKLEKLGVWLLFLYGGSRNFSVLLYLEIKAKKGKANKEFLITRTT